jgi:uncharacterized protein YcfJ
MRDSGVSHEEKSMNAALRTAMVVAGLALATQAAAEITLYEHDGFQGRSFTTNRQLNNFERQGFNDRASSVVVLGQRWEACQDAQFRGQCIVLRPGRYPSLSAMGLNDRISSVRAVSSSARYDDHRYAPAPQPVYDNRRRKGERIYEAEVTSVRAVHGQPEQRCWVEREQVSQGRGDANIPGAVIGGLIGGVLGHQVGSGRGNDVATVGGAVAGAAIGSQVGRNDSSGQVHTRDVQRCTSAPSQANPDYWDVTYNFRGQEHRIQTAAPPGRTVMVNAQGEPRA